MENSHYVSRLVWFVKWYKALFHEIAACEECHEIVAADESDIALFIALVEFNELINKIASLDLEFTCILILKTVVDNVFVTGPHFN